MTKSNMLETIPYSHVSNDGYYVVNGQGNFDEPSGTRIWGGGPLPNAIKKDGEVFVPIKILVEQFGATANWDSATRTLSISSHIPQEERMTQAELDTLLGFTLSQAENIARQEGYEPEHPGSGWRYFWNGKAYWHFYIWSDEFLSEEYAMLVELTYPYAEVGSDYSLKIEWEGP